MAIERPRCEFRGAPPHPAKPAYMLVWKLPSGDVTKFSCAGHRFRFGGSAGYWVNEVECYEDNKGEQVGTEFVVLPDAPVDDKPLSEATCVDPECGNPAGLIVASKKLLGSNLLPKNLLPATPKPDEGDESAA